MTFDTLVHAPSWSLRKFPICNGLDDLEDREAIYLSAPINHGRCATNTETSAE